MRFSGNWLRAKPRQSQTRPADELSVGQLFRGKSVITIVFIKDENGNSRGPPSYDLKY